MSVASPLILANRPMGRIRPQLDSLRRALAERGDPQLDFQSILIVGTNGKGSTAIMLEAVLRAHGVETGLFTSPHLVRVEERVRLMGRPVAETVLGEHVRRFDAFPDLTYFEVLTAAAFSIFSDARVDIAVLEAGMGGSWDATRLADSAIAGLTNVGSDHSRWLGAGPAAVASDKGQALAAAERAIVGSGIDDDLVNALGTPNARPAGWSVSCSDGSARRVSIRWGDRETVVGLPLLGEFQLRNLELALALAVEAAAAGWVDPLEPTKVREAIESVSWPGRLSTHLVQGREVLMDCAHNLEAAIVLARYLEGLERRRNLLFSCLDDKPVEAMAAVLRPYVGDVILCPLDDERAMPMERLTAAFPDAETADEPSTALARLGDPVLATGSVRLIGELLALVSKEPVS